MTNTGTHDITAVTDDELARIDGGGFWIEIAIAVAFDIVNNYKEYAKEFEAGMNAAMQ